MNRILVTVDVSNLYYSIKKRFGDRKVDYRKIQKYCRERGFVYRSVAYGPEMENKADSFYACLKALGFEVKIKAIKEYHSKDGIKKKCDQDMDIGVDIIRYSNHYDELILVCSDGDMIPVVKYVQERGIKVHVLSCAINNDLREVVDSWLEIGPSFLEKVNDEKSEITETA